MRRRVVAIVLAVVLAGLGTIALVAYVQSAKDAAVAGEALVDVYLVDRHLDVDAPAAAIRGAVHLEKVPQRLVQDGAVTNLAQLGDRVVAAPLERGDQLIAGKLKAADATPPFTVPKDKVQVTVSLTPDRAAGGTVRVGDAVSVFLSFDPFEVDASGTAIPATTVAGATTTATTVATKKTPNMTHLQFSKVLVTAVQYGEGSTTTTTEASQTVRKGTDPVPTAPTGKLLVTLALSPADAEQLVFAVEFGHVYLAAEPEGVPDEGRRIVTLGGVYSVLAR
jgi:pilus assembly protein CpaB